MIDCVRRHILVWVAMGFTFGGAVYAQSPSSSLQVPDPRYFPRDPYREIGGQTNFAKSPGWVVFKGTVLAVSKSGILLSGYFGTVGIDQMNYFVHDYPYPIKEGERLGYGQPILMAKEDGFYEFESPSGARETVRKLEYGKVCDVAATNSLADPSVLHAQKTKEAQAKAALNARTLAWLQERAANGDAGAQFRLGEKYLTGDGVDKSLLLARTWLEKALASGSDEARHTLAKMAPTNGPDSRKP